MNRLHILLVLTVVGLAACASPKKPGITDVQPTPPPREPEAVILQHLLAAEISGRRGEMDMALSYYLAAARLSDDPRIAQRAVTIALHEGAQEAAIEMALRRVNLEPESTEARRTAGFLLLTANRVEEAAEHLDAVILTTDDAGEEEFSRLASIIGRQGDHETTLGVARFLADRYPGLATAHALHARMSMRAEAYAEAATAATRALEIAPGRQEYLILRVNALTAGGEPQRAINELTHALDRSPLDADLRLLRARLYLDLRHHDEAREDFEFLVEQRPEDGEMLFMLAMLNLAAERSEDAERHLHRLVELGERVDDAYFFLGSIARTHGDIDKALAHYARVTGGERFDEARIYSADLLAERGHIAEARAELHALRSFTEDEQSILNSWLAESEILRMHANDLVGAKELLDRALIEFPGDSRLLYARALTAERLNQVDLAEADLRAILDRDPEDVHALNALGYTLADRTDRYEDAYRYIKRAIEIAPDDAAIQDSMGWVLYRLGRFEEAEVWLRSAYALSTDPEIASNLATVLWAMGNRQEARAILDASLKQHPDHDRLLETRDRLDF